MGASNILIAVTGPAGAVVGLGLIALVGGGLLWSYRMLRDPGSRPINGVDGDAGTFVAAEAADHSDTTASCESGDCGGADSGDGGGGGD